MVFWDLPWSQKGFVCSYIGLWEAPRRAPKILKGVSDANPVNIGQLDHFMVFRTKSIALQDFQRGKTCPIGVKQTPFDPPGSPQNSLKPPNPLSDPPFNRFNPLSYLKTH